MIVKEFKWKFRVDCCNVCPARPYLKCKIMDKPIEGNGKIIPEWCPLKDFDVNDTDYTEMNDVRNL